MESFHDFVVQNLLYFESFCRVEDNDSFQQVGQGGTEVLHDVDRLGGGGHLNFLYHRPGNLGLERLYIVF